MIADTTQAYEAYALAMAAARPIRTFEPPSSTAAEHRIDVGGEAAVVLRGTWEGPERDEGRWKALMGNGDYAGVPCPPSWRLRATSAEAVPDRIPT